MSDIVEKPIVNGRQFELTVRETDHRGRAWWVATVKVPGRERHSVSSAFFSGLSEGHVRDQAERWMLKYRS